MKFLKRHPYLRTFLVIFALLCLLILSGKTQTGEAYPPATGVFVALFCAVPFSVPFWAVQGICAFGKKRGWWKAPARVKEAPPAEKKKTQDVPAKPGKAAEKKLNLEPPKPEQPAAPPAPPKPEPPAEEENAAVARWRDKRRQLEQNRQTRQTLPPETKSGGAE